MISLDDMTRRFIALGTATILSVCCVVSASSSSAQGTPRGDTYYGQYSFGFEKSEFIPSGRHERWWLSGNIGDIEQRAISPVFVSVEGQLSEPGRYGHLGAYSRELIVKRVLLVQQSAR